MWEFREIITAISFSISSSGSPALREKVGAGWVFFLVLIFYSNNNLFISSEKIIILKIKKRFIKIILKNSF